VANLRFNVDLQTEKMEKGISKKKKKKHFLFLDSEPKMGERLFFTVSLFLV